MSSIGSYAAKWFFDKRKLDGKLSKGKRKALIRTGALVRTIARRMLKKSRRGWTKESRERFRAAKKRFLQEQAYGKLGSLKPPDPAKFTRAIPSKPYEPPRDKTGILKRTILFGFDPIKESVAIGPIKFGPGTARVIDHGGRVTLKGYHGRKFSMYYWPRPLMRPARKAANPKVKKFFAKIL